MFFFRGGNWIIVATECLWLCCLVLVVVFGGLWLFLEGVSGVFGVFVGAGGCGVVCVGGRMRAFEVGCVCVGSGSG